MKWLKIIALLGMLYFCCLIMYRALQLKHYGIPISPKSGKIKSVLQLLTLSAFILLFIAEIINSVFHLSFGILPRFLSSVIYTSDFMALPGVLLILISIVALHFTLIAFDKSLRFGLDADNTGKLVTNGIFAYTRNPFFISIELLFTGIALVICSPFFIGIALLSFIGIHIFILKEERFMRANYGKNYIEYAAKVNRYF